MNSNALSNAFKVILKHSCNFSGARLQSWFSLVSDEIGAKLLECLSEFSNSYAGFKAAIEYETLVFCGVKKSYPYSCTLLITET